MVSTSAFYDWLAREPSERDREDELLATHIRAIHKASKGTYGSPRVHAELRRGGFDVSRKRVIRIMQRLGLRARRPRKWKTTTVSTPGATVAPNRLKRDFTAKAPNKVWTANITYMWTWEGWLYLAAIVDLFSRRVVGWAAADHMRGNLVLEAQTSSSTCSPGPRDVRRSRPPPTSSTPGTTPGASTPRWGTAPPQRPNSSIVSSSWRQRNQPVRETGSSPGSSQLRCGRAAQRAESSWKQRSPCLSRGCEH